MSKRFVEIKGIGIPNKGAELMLIAVQEKVGEMLPGHHFCCEPTGDYYPRARYGLFQRTGFTVRQRYIDWSVLAKWLPGRIRNRYGLVTEEQMDVIIDASGFAYGDQWGYAKLHNRLGKRIRRWKEQGKKIVLLPQAFGPFSDKAVRQEMTRILKYADLVFARDQQSLAHLNDLLPGKALLSPDFTNLVSSPAIPAQYQAYIGRPCLIPNSKMITMVKNSQGYVGQMAACLEAMLSEGEQPFILIHEGLGDIKLGEEIASCLSYKVDILVPNDALIIKSIIGQCSFVVSSRFHGLVSALSQGVPVVATGWSHKYRELLKDYDVDEFVVDGEEGVNKTKFLLNAVSRDNVKKRILAKGGVEKVKSEEMWGKVFSLIARKS